MQLANARHAAHLLAPLLQGRPHEALAVAHIGPDGRFLTVMERSGGKADIELPMRDILADSLRLGSRAIILAHNHPSGDSAPSRADIAATRHLAELCHAVGIGLRDHLIFGSASCSSMRAMGLL